MLAFCVEFTDNPCGDYLTQPTEDDRRQRMSWFIEALRKYAVFSGRSGVKSTGISLCSLSSSVSCLPSLMALSGLTTVQGE